MLKMALGNYFLGSIKLRPRKQHGTRNFHFREILGLVTMSFVSLRIVSS